jgi:hypothetical protein
LSIAELTIKFSLPVPLNASGLINKLFLYLHHPSQLVGHALAWSAGINRH